jgi:hypothetical protein
VKISILVLVDFALNKNIRLCFINQANLEAPPFLGELVVVVLALVAAFASGSSPRLEGT